jgi:DNA-binding XRE family transcriptional regulator
MNVGTDEAADALRRALSATDEALRAVSAVEQVWAGLLGSTQTLVRDGEAWAAAGDSYREAEQQLHRARGYLEQVLTQVLRGQEPEARARAAIDELVRLHAQMQNALDEATNLAKRSYESMRPAIMAYYLAHATRRPRWIENWPHDAEAVAAALAELETEGDINLVDQLDIALARFRWEVGWSQQQMAEVAGVSQPSVAARLGRIEGLLNLRVGLSHVVQQAARDNFRVTASRIRTVRDPRGATAEIELESNKYSVQLDLLVASGDGGAPRRGGAPERGIPLDYHRLLRARAGSRARDGLVQGVAIYSRDTGAVGYYTATEFAEQLAQIGRTPVGVWLEQLQQTRPPVWSLRDLVERLDRVPR